jgi:signal transduction histidine kinase
MCAIASAAFATAMLLLFAFIYWQTAGYETARIDQFLHNEVEAIAREPAQNIAADVDSRFAGDLHRLTFAAVFAADGRVIAGGLAELPAGLQLDGMVHRATVMRAGARGPELESVRVVARRLPDGRVLVLGRSEDELVHLRGLVWRALQLGLIPGVILALVAGTFASLRTLSRIRSMNQTLARVMDGKLRERLPARGTSDALDQLAGSVNRMLDEIGRLIDEIQGVGDDIAHDLRTPLTRVRSRLEGGLNRARTRDELGTVVETAIGDLDQVFATITALLRIGQIEAERRREGFAVVCLASIAEEAGDLYLPLAELKGVSLEVDAAPGQQVFADGDLLFEMVANLVDNAVKFAPPGGRVRLVVEAGVGGPVLRVQDSSPGIAPDEQQGVLRRNYRADRRRQSPGSGLGLSIVTAILRLHGYKLGMDHAEGLFSVNVTCCREPDLASGEDRSLAAIDQARVWRWLRRVQVLGSSDNPYGARDRASDLSPQGRLPEFNEVEAPGRR